jgi:predicted kinase
MATPPLFGCDVKGNPLDPMHHWNSGSRVVPQRQSFSIPHYVRPSAIPVTLVCGAPGAGKTTYVRQHEQPGDVIIDLDDIKQSICNDRYSDDAAVVKRAFRVRGDLIYSLARREAGRAWLIVVAPTNEERVAWLAALGPKATMQAIDTGRAECHRRIDADPSRRDHRPMLHAEIDAYFRESR